ncbi:hypothetical protein [Ktedonobacter sp. SOSP1-52]|uniref:hypothetical protein n=1 Tax=Ktedonobacter sp. SOSP1-52 TaxID=2778366 RepID=UPI001916596A|nr:hypothetical protein [Ktedonobacter sp. SOSP1-52]
MWNYEWIRNSNMSQSDSTTSKPTTPQLDLEEQSRQSMQAVGKLIEEITPWLFEFGSWIFGGLIAFILLIIPALITVGPTHPTILVSITTFACALPLNVAGLFLLKLVQDMKSAGLDEQALHAFQDSGFPIEAYFPQEGEALHRKRKDITLRYSVGILVLGVLLTLAGMIAALWYMAWWVGVIFLTMVLVSQVLVVIVFAHTLPPESEKEKEQKRYYKEYRSRQRKG